MIAPVARGILAGLKLRERQVALGIADGLGDKQIARNLAVTGETIVYHKRKLFREFGVSNRVVLAVLIDRELRNG